MGGSQPPCRQLTSHMGHCGRKSQGHHLASFPGVPEWMMLGCILRGELSLRAEGGVLFQMEGTALQRLRDGRAKSWIIVWSGQGREKRLEGPQRLVMCGLERFPSASVFLLAGLHGRHTKFFLSVFLFWILFNLLCVAGEWVCFFCLETKFHNPSE